MGINFLKFKDGSIQYQDIKSVVDQDILDFIYDNRQVFDRDISYIFTLKPYGDTILDTDKLNDLLKAFKLVVANSFLYYSYENQEQIKEIRSLIEYIDHAIKSNETLIAIGD